MDRRSWPWKKKSSDKGEKAAAADSGGASFASGGSQDNKDNYKKPSYVQISVESYTRLTGLEDQVQMYGDKVQTLEDQIKELNEKLSATNSEMTTKDNLVKQHAKVAEEAVSGWEKAEAEALALKNHLESVTLSKLTVEDRAAHLDGALKECMRQIRNLKEDHEQKLQEVVLIKNKQCEKIKLELEAKIVNLDQELLRSAAENAALSRSLQERSNMLIQINDEKTQAEAEIELLKSNVESCEREINSLKYELHVVSKELEIRNEEKNMSMRSSEAANKQHMEGIKKIAKLEAECQRLRGLVRKKLPGPAALAQMKLEVENLGRDYGDSRLRKSPVKNTNPHHSSLSEFPLDNAQNFHKEHEFLAERLLTMEEETKMLKEALAKRNTELQASRNLCAKIASRLQSLEAQLHISNHEKSSPKSIALVPAEGYSTLASHPPSLTSLSEDGNDDERSCADSWATTLMSESSQVKKEKSSEKSNNAKNKNNLELMDDFLEMEKLACQNANDVTTISDSPNTKTSGIVISDGAGEVSSGKDTPYEGHRDLDTLVKHVASDAYQPPSIENLRSNISILLQSLSKDADMERLLEDVKRFVQDANNLLHQHSVSCTSEEVHGLVTSCNNQTYPEDACLTGEKEITLSQDSKGAIEAAETVSQELVDAFSQIHNFTLFLGKEAMPVYDTSSGSNSLGQKIEEFSVTYNKVLCHNASLINFVLDLSHVLAEVNELSFNVLGYKGTEVEINSPDCIDKVALPENKAVQKDSLGETYLNGRPRMRGPSSNPEVPDDGNLVSGYGSNGTSCKVSLDEFEELKSQKDNMAMDLVRCTEDLQMVKSQLLETEQLLAEVKSQLASAQKSNSLAETQLKCMAESYRLLETRAEELETVVNLLRAKTETLENELKDEKRNHQDALTRCKELQEQLQANESCSVCSSTADIDLKTKQDRELAAAAEKLAECQETIFLLGKQFKALRPQTEFMGSPYSERTQRGDGVDEDEPTTTSGLNSQDYDQAEMETAASANMRKVDAESPLDDPRSPSDNEANFSKSPNSTMHPKHRSVKPTSSSPASAPTPEKTRGISRFFSSKGKNGY